VSSKVFLIDRNHRNAFKVYYQVGYLKRLVRIIDTILHQFFKKKIVRAKIRKILLLRQDRIGDVILTSSVFGILKKSFPNAQIDIIVSAGKRSLIEENPFIHQIIEQKENWFDYKADVPRVWRAVCALQTLFSSEFWRLAAELRRRRYDVAIDFIGKRRNILLSFLAGITYRIGNYVWGGSFLLTNRIPLEYNVHYTQQMLSCLAPLGIGGSIPEVKVYPPKPVATENLGRYASLKKTGKILVGISINDALQKGKEWRKENWKELIELMIHDQRFQIVVFCSPARGMMTDEIVGDFIELDSVQCEVPQDIASLVHLVNTLDLLVSVDGGPVHIGAGLDIPIVVLYGSSDPVIWGPLHKKSRIIRKAGLDMLVVDRLFEDDTYINGIKPVEVYETSLELLREIEMLN